jgi:hypothetical protein
MIRIHIRRKVPEDKADDLKLLINRLRGVTMGTPGYIAGETLKRIDKPGESLVVTKWQSEFYWEQEPRQRPNGFVVPRIEMLTYWRVRSAFNPRDASPLNL